MAYILDKDVQVGDVISTIKKASSKILQEVGVFDLYEGDKIDSNKKSVAFNLLYNGIDRTLTDEEVMDDFNKIVSKVVEKFKCELRDK